MILVNIAFKRQAKNLGHAMLEWDAGKDFKIIGKKPDWWIGGIYFSKRDIQTFIDNDVTELYINTEEGLKTMPL